MQNADLHKRYEFAVVANQKLSLTLHRLIQKLKKLTENRKYTCSKTNKNNK